MVWKKWKVQMSDFVTVFIDGERISIQPEKRANHVIFIKYLKHDLIHHIHPV